MCQGVKDLYTMGEDKNTAMPYPIVINPGTLHCYQLTQWYGDEQLDHVEIKLSPVLLMKQGRRVQSEA